MNNVQDNEIVKVFEQLKQSGTEIFLTEEGWLHYEELLIEEEKAS